MTIPVLPDTAASRAFSALMFGLLVMSGAGLLSGLVLWLVHPHGAPASVLLTSGLIGLLAIPVVKLVAVLVAAAGDRDWLTLGATLAVIVILFALTLRDALTVGWGAA